MQKNLPRWAFGVLSVVGIALVGSMLLNWIDVGGAWQMSGLGLAWEANHWMFLVPIAGVALVAAAATRSTHTRLAAIGAGIAVTGYVLFDVTRSMIHSGLDTWLVLGGAGLLLAGASKGRSALRLLGGAAVLVGFFAPWADFSMFKELTGGHSEGFTINVMWIVPLAGVTGVISAASKASGSKLAAASGIAIYGTFLFVIGAVALFVFGLGAWIALGASTVALVIGVLARGPAAAVVSAPAKASAKPSAA